MSTPPKPISTTSMALEKLSLAQGRGGEPLQQQSLQQQQQRVLDFIVVEDGVEREENNAWGSSNAADDDTLDSSTPTLDEKAEAVPSSPSPPLPSNRRPVQRRRPFRFRYTDAALQSALFTAGVKPRLAKKISKAVFAQLTTSSLSSQLPGEEGDGLSSVTLPRREFASLVSAAAEAFLSKNEKQDQPPSLHLSPSSFETACGLVERRTPVALLLAGTSGSGKTTLAGLLAARLGGATVVSTDSIRHVLASSLDPDSREARLLRCSTYEAGDLLSEWERGDGNAGREDGDGDGKDDGTREETPSSLDRASVVRGYEAQSALVQPALERIVSSAAARGESVVVEGAHVGVGFAVFLAANGRRRPRPTSAPSDGPSSPSPPSPPLHPCAAPFLVHISNEAKHRERFAVRSKAMVAINDDSKDGTSRSKSDASNRYVAALPRIRAIQEHLLSLARLHRVPAVDNTSVDRSVEAVASAVLGCARRVAGGGELVSVATAASSTDAAPSPPVLTCRPVAAEFAAATAALWSSKAALGLIRQKRQLQRQQRRRPNEDDGGASVVPPATPAFPVSVPHAPSPSAPSTSAASSPPRALSELDAFFAADEMERQRRRTEGSRSRGRRPGTGGDGDGGRGSAASDSAPGSPFGGASSPSRSPSPSSERDGDASAGAEEAKGAGRDDDDGGGAPLPQPPLPTTTKAAVAFPLSHPLARPAARALLAAAAAADAGGVSCTEGEEEEDDDEEEEEERSGGAH